MDIEASQHIQEKQSALHFLTCEKNEYLQQNFQTLRIHFHLKLDNPIHVSDISKKKVDSINNSSPKQ